VAILESLEVERYLKKGPDHSDPSKHGKEKVAGVYARR